MNDNDKMVTSDDDELSSSDGEDKELEDRATGLEGELANNKYLYEVHLEVVEIYRKLGDIKSMREAYNRFSEYFPLTATIWLAWIKDEVKLATTSSEKKHVLTLFEKAVKDYLSVDVWLEYIQYTLGNCELEETYKVLEKGLTTAGLHANQGSLLWDLLRELELTQLGLHKELSDKWKQQVVKVVDAFKRQLSVPLMHMESIYAEWNEWVQRLPSDYTLDLKPVEWGYQQALKTLKTYQPFEDQLLTEQDDEALYGTYKEYIKVTKNPVTIVCLYERAVAQLSLNTSLWSDYCIYAMSLGDLSDEVSKKAVRNCPWSEELWITRMRILEHNKCGEQLVTQCLEQGLVSIAPSPGLNLWLAYIEFIRRSSTAPEHLHKIITQGAEHLGETGDPTFKLLRLQARLYARAGNMTEAQRIWSSILQYSSNKELANVWLEYIALEKQYGNAQQLRSLYQRAIAKCTDWPQFIAEDWQMYERECGTLQDMLKYEDKCKHINKAIAQQNFSEEEPVESKKRSRPQDGNDPKIKRLKISDDPKTKPFKKNVTVADINTDTSVFVSNMRSSVTDEDLQKMFPSAKNICIPTDRKGGSRCFAYVQFETETEVTDALDRDRELLQGRPLFISKCVREQSQRRTPFKYSTQGENNKLFVRGLPKKLTQEDVENIFKPYGSTTVRLVSLKSGQSKGLAYVEFKDKAAAEEALKVTDQMDIDGFVITVAISAPPQKKQYDDSDLLVPTRHARSRIQLPLVPRSVQTKQSDSMAPGTSKSNEDFRKMLLNKN